MSKNQDAKKNVKKAPSKTPKEKEGGEAPQEGRKERLDRAGHGDAGRRGPSCPPHRAF